MCAQIDQEVAGEKLEEMKVTNFKDSERAAPEAVQSTTHRPLKKVRVAVTMHMHEVADQGQEVDTRRKNLLERIKAKFAERNSCPQDRKSKAGKIESGKDDTESRKSKAGLAEAHGSGKKLKAYGKEEDDCHQREGSHHCQPAALTRKRMREELEERIGDMKIQRARIEEQSEIRRMRSLKRKLENPDEATFEADPQLPGRKDGTRKILERLRNRSKGSRDANSTRPCKSIRLHEREAITRLINGGGASSSTDRRNASGACGVGKLVSAIA